MLRFGFDFINEDNSLTEPNGIINHKDAKGQAFNLFSPPWWGDLLNVIQPLEWSLDSVDNIVKQELDSKWIYMLEVAGDSRGWLGKYSNDDENVVKSLTSGMSKTALKQLQQNKAVVVVYQAGESAPVNFMDYNIYEEFYKEIIRCKISPTNFVFITGNMIAQRQFNEWKPYSDFKDEKNFHIIEFSGYRHINYPKKWKLAKKNQDKKIDKHFLCYNRNMAHPHRLLILTLLEKENLIQNGLVSYPIFSKRNFSGKMSHNFNIGKRLRNELLKCAEKLQDRAPSIIDVDEWDTNHFDTSPAWPYEKTFFSLVSESQYVEDTLFLSEKIWKAIANQHPFVLVGSYKTLNYLKEQGFETFEPFIDESYDDEKNPYKRIKKIIEEVKRLCSMDEKQIKKFLSDIDNILEYNYDKLINSHDNVNRTFRKLEMITDV